jgi:hypothetical protein
MLQLSVLFVLLYCLSFKCFRTCWKRWLFWIFLIALPIGILSVLFLVLGLTFSATLHDFPRPKYLGAFMAAISGYFMLLLMLCQSVQWASIGLSKLSRKIAQRWIETRLYRANAVDADRSITHRSSQAVGDERSSTWTRTSRSLANMTVGIPGRRLHLILWPLVVLLVSGGLLLLATVFSGGRPTFSMRSPARVINGPPTGIAVLSHQTLNLKTNASDWNANGGWLRLCLIDSTGTRRFFVSYRGRLIELYFGWKPSGSFGIALRKANFMPVTGPWPAKYRPRELQRTNAISFWKALVYVEEPQRGYHPSWPEWLRFAGWWIRNPFPGLTEFWLGLNKPIEIHEQIDGRWTVP